ncbi:MAG TPA: hypothetical protein VKR06_40555 [Ktedonosporobacter sp.]|nr:hypothetical protein [Ktedonosporobacter sp.]
MMNVRQYYYTSYVHRATGNAGFQIKAMSPGIPADLQAMLAHLIEYRIPPGCDIGKLETHPVALRYVYEGPGTGMLLCSQSCGQDEHGRPGNFFAHALLLEEDLITRVPPICYWKSPFWRNADPQEYTDIVSLPLLSLPDQAFLLEGEQIWTFLMQGNRPLWLYQLLCAIIHSGRSGRRIVLLDSAEHVALWIAAANYLLPPPYRPLLTFATYHHDPYQAPYLITGTTADSSFKASHEDYLSYFVLNAQEGIVSSAPPSPYARLAVRAVCAGRYEDILQPFFAEYAPASPQSARFDGELDLLALYAAAQPNADLDQTAAMRFPPAFCQEVQSVIATFSKEHSTSVIDAALSTWMRAEVTYETHLRLVQALFPTSLRLGVAYYFWQAYFRELAAALHIQQGGASHASLSRGIEMLNFWFTVSPSCFQQGYPVQHGLLLLSALLSRDRKLLHGLASSVAGRSWGPSLHLLAREGPLTLLSRQFMARWQRAGMRSTRGKERPLSGKPPTLEEEMSLLFTGDTVIEQHMHCATLYAALSPSRFWSNYWQHFTRVLLAHDVDRLLTILSFWFEQAYESLGTTAYLPQEFFLGLPPMLEQVMHLPQAREILPLLHDDGLHAERYPWYPLVLPYFGR